MGDDDQPLETLSESIGSPINCSLHITTEMFTQRVNIPLKDSVYPPGDYIYAYAIITAKVGNDTKQWMLLPPPYFGLEKSDEWEQIKAQWQDAYEYVKQHLSDSLLSMFALLIGEPNLTNSAAEAPSVKKLKRATEGITDSKTLNPLEWGTARIAEEAQVRISEHNEKLWERFATLLPECYRICTAARKRSRKARTKLPPDLLAELDKFNKEGKNVWKPYQVAYVYCARTTGVMGVASLPPRMSDYKTISRRYKEFQLSRRGTK